jgi:hypothetical protein
MGSYVKIWVLFPRSKLGTIARSFIIFEGSLPGALTVIICPAGVADRETLKGLRVRGRQKTRENIFVQQWHMAKVRFQSLLRQTELCRKFETRVTNRVERKCVGFKVPAVPFPFCFHSGSLRGSVSYREDGGVMLLRNVGTFSKNYTPVCPRCLRSLEHNCWFHDFIL